jgi:hypothetical protein
MAVFWISGLASSGSLVGKPCFVVMLFFQFERCRGSRLGPKDAAVASHAERSRRSCECRGTTEWQSGAFD